MVIPAGSRISIKKWRPTQHQKYHGTTIKPARAAVPQQESKQKGAIQNGGARWRRHSRPRR
jgi:hypothetical protein